MTTKEKPIIFSGPSIPAIQNLKPGTWPPEPIDPGKPFKWQTRRVVKADIVNGFDIDVDGSVIAYIDQATGDSFKPADIAPYRPGDTLYVREMWKCVRYNNMDGDLQFGVTYKVDGKTIYVEFDDNERYEKFGKFAFKEGWQPSIFMPQEAARLFLEVKNVRLERLQEITEKDAIAEGCITFQDKLDGGELLRGVTEFDLTARDAYADLWDSINGKKHPWASNPYVWVYEFMRRERQ